VGLLNIQVGLKVAQQSVTQNVAIIVINLVTPKARAKHEHLFNEPASVFRTSEIKQISEQNYSVKCFFFYSEAG
jgi:hypothetical protein